MHKQLLERFVISKAPSQPLYTGRVCAYLPCDLSAFKFSASIDRLDLKVEVERGLRTPRTKWDDVQRVLLEATGETLSVAPRTVNGIREEAGRHFTVVIQNPTGPMLEAVQKAVRGRFGSGSCIDLGGMEVALDVFSRNPSRNSENLQEAFNLLRRHLLPAGDPSRWRVGYFAMRDGRKTRQPVEDPCDDRIGMPMTTTTYFGNKSDPFFYRLYLKTRDRITDKNDPLSGRELPEKEKRVRLEVQFSQFFMREEMELETLEDLLSNGLPSMMEYFRFVVPTPRDWRSHPMPLVKKIRAWLADFELTWQYEDQGVWRRALTEWRKRPALDTRKKFGFAAHNQLSAAVRVALRDTERKMKIGKHRVS